MTIRLRHLAEVNPATPEFDRLPPDTLVPFLPLEAVWPGDMLDVSHRRIRREVSVGYTRFREGDILIPKITPTFQANRTVIACGIEGGIGAGTTELHLVRVGDLADHRYVRYLLSSKPVLNEGEASMIGVAGQKRVPDNCFRDLRVPVTDLNDQRTIADYLDSETGRIDTLIAKRRRMIELLNERCEGVVEQSMRMLVESHGSIPLKHAALRVEVGIVVTPASWYANAGVIALRGLNIKPGNIILDDVVRISSEGHRLHQKSELRQGDIVVVRTGQAGTAAVVPAELDGCNCIDLVIIRPSARVLPKFLELVLNSDWTQKHIDEHSVGTIQSHFNVGAMKGVPIPLPSLREQADVADALSHEVQKIHKITDKLGRQIALLRERRQALITAAVSGEIDVPGRAA